MEGPCNECAFPLRKNDDNLSFLEGGTPLMCAAVNGHEHCAHALLKAGADVNKRDRYRNTSLIWASARDHERCVELLIKFGADVNLAASGGETALHSAAFRGHIKYLDLLLKAGADASVRSDQNDTPLTYAMRDDHRECVGLLTKAGADVNMVNVDGSTILIMAAYWCRTECMEILIQAGADVNKKDNVRRTALIAALGPCHVKAVDALIQAGADVNCSDVFGITPLISIVSQIVTDNDDINSIRRVLCMKKLLKAGAHINQTDNRGNNALATRVRRRKNIQNKNDTLSILLFAAGESLPDADLQNERFPESLRAVLSDTSLKHLCRKRIRSRLVQLKPHVNLFGVIPQLELPSLLESYLLYDVSLESE